MHEARRDLSEDEVRLGMQAEKFIDLLAHRYNLSPHEVVDAVRWVQQHKEFVSKMKHGGFISLIGIIISAAMLSLWEGIKAYARRAG